MAGFRLEIKGIRQKAGASSGAEKGLRTANNRPELKDCFFQNEATDVVENKGSVDKMA